MARKPRKVSLQDLKKKVEEIAARHKRGVYNPRTGICSYSTGIVKDGPQTKGCLLGQALREMGILARVVRKGLDKKTVRNILPHVCFKKDLDPGDSYNESLVDWMCDVQVSQDEGSPWGSCVKSATKRWLKAD